MYLLNIYYNAEVDNSYLVQVWDINNEMEKLVIALDNEESLFDDNLVILVKDLLRDHLSYREGEKIIINPASSSLDGKSFDELIQDATQGLIFVPIGYSLGPIKTH